MPTRLMRIVPLWFSSVSHSVAQTLSLFLFILNSDADVSLCNLSQPELETPFDLQVVLQALPVLAEFLTSTNFHLTVSGIPSTF
jgi:hypothetical protein